MTDYARPDDLATALRLRAGGSRLVLAGGTDVYPARAGQALRGPVLDLSAVSELKGMAKTPHGLRIGACVTWAEIAAADLPPALTALQQAARDVGGPQIQNAGTLGGNLCNASPAADGVPPLLVLGATVELASAQGIRHLALADFITGPRRTVLRPDELVAAVLLPRAALTGRSAFVKLGARKYQVIAIASVAVRLLEREGRVADVAVAVGACGAVPQRLPDVEAALIGAALSEAAGRITDGAVAAGLAPLDDIRASAAYRHAASAELVRRTVAGLTGGAA